MRAPFAANGLCSIKDELHPRRVAAGTEREVDEIPQRVLMGNRHLPHAN